MNSKSKIALAVVVGAALGAAYAPGEGRLAEVRFRVKS